MWRMPYISTSACIDWQCYFMRFIVTIDFSQWQSFTYVLTALPVGYLRRRYKFNIFFMTRLMDNIFAAQNDVIFELLRSSSPTVNYIMFCAISILIFCIILVNELN